MHGIFLEKTKRWIDAMGRRLRPASRRCHRCRGKGQVGGGILVHGQWMTVELCPECKGKGWVR